MADTPDLHSIDDFVRQDPHNTTIDLVSVAGYVGAVPARIDALAIDVADTGPGIPADHLETIFEEFVRLESHKGLPGSGLGLAIARRVAVLLGGDITVTSSPAGATFTLWLPRDRRSLQSESVAA